MWTAMKAGCLVIYTAALAGTVGLLPAGIGRTAQGVAALMLLLHAIELAFVFGHVRRYRGPLAVSVLLTLLFGLLHWRPLAGAAAAAGRGRGGA